MQTVLTVLTQTAHIAAGVGFEGAGYRRPPADASRA